MNQITAKMNCFNFEMTRRCNLNCIWCYKGKAQNKDITKEVIDKSLDELQGIALYSLRFFGGEPFLVPELLEYVVDGVIKRHLIIGTAHAFTNGTIQDERVINAFNRLAIYLKSIESEIESMNLHEIEGIFSTEYIDDGFEPGCKVFISISQSYHDNAEVANSTFEYYTTKKDDLVTIRLEGRHDGEQKIDIVGNADKNFHELVEGCTNPEFYAGKRALRYYNFRIPLHKYMINLGDTFILKSVTVSTNGNIYIGLTETYDATDTDPVLNIFECDSDLVSRLVDYGWKYPVSPKMNKFRERYMTAKYLREHGYYCLDGKGIPMDDDDFLKFTILFHLSEWQEECACKLHEQYPMLDHREVEAISALMTLLRIEDDEALPELCKFEYVNTLTYFHEQEILGDLSPEWCKVMIDAWLYSALKRLGIEEDVAS